MQRSRYAVRPAVVLALALVGGAVGGLVAGCSPPAGPEDRAAGSAQVPALDASTVAEVGLTWADLPVVPFPAGRSRTGG